MCVVQLLRGRSSTEGQRANGYGLNSMVQERIKHTTLRRGAFPRMKAADDDKDNDKDKAKNKNKHTNSGNGNDASVYKAEGAEVLKLRNPFRKLMRSKRHGTSHHASMPGHLQPSVSTASTGSGSSTHSSRPSQGKKKGNRKTIFRLHESEMSVYKSAKDPGDAPAIATGSSIHHIIKNSKPSLIAQGKFQIYQMNSALNYLSCGPLTHPILPSCTIIKINTNTYIIPIKNPVRYWRLTLNTDDESILHKFESTVQPISKFKVDLLVDFTLSSPFCTIIDTSTAHTSSSSVTLKSFLHVDSEDDSPKTENAIDALTLHHPIPVRPNSASTTSLKSSILRKYNTINSNSSLNTSQVSFAEDMASTRKGSDIHAVSESTEIQKCQNIKSSDDLNGNTSPNLLVDLDFDSDLDLDLDLELDLDLDQDLDLSLKMDSLDMDSHLGVMSTNMKGFSKGKRSISASDLDDLDEVDLDSEELLCMWNNIGDGITKRYSLSFKAYDLKKPISIDVFDKYRRNIKSVLKSEGAGIPDNFLNH